MGPVGHSVVSLVGAGLVYSIFGNFISAAIFFISGFLIDVDHFFDYGRQYGLRNFKIRNFCESCFELRIEKVFIVLHSFELLLVLWIFITVYKLNILWISLALGVSTHLIIDQFTNRTFALSYFFTYRWIKHFTREELFRKRKRDS